MHSKPHTHKGFDCTCDECCYFRINAIKIGSICRHVQIDVASTVFNVAIAKTDRRQYTQLISTDIVYVIGFIENNAYILLPNFKICILHRQWLMPL